MGITATTLHTREIKCDRVCNNTVWYPEGAKCKFPGGPVIKTMEPDSIPDRGTKTLQAMQQKKKKKKKKSPWSTHQNMFRVLLYGAKLLFGSTLQTEP